MNSNELKSPESSFKKPGTSNENMRCFIKIKKKRMEEHEVKVHG